MKFNGPMDRILEGCGGDEEVARVVKASTLAFTSNIARNANQIAMREDSAFSIFHADFSHNNIVKDDHYNILSVID